MLLPHKKFSFTLYDFSKIPEGPEGALNIWGFFLNSVGFKLRLPEQKFKSNFTEENSADMRPG